MSTRDPGAKELRAVAPLVAMGETPVLVGAVLLVANGDRFVGVTSAELVRPFHGKPLVVMTKLDGSASLVVASWGMGRYSGLGIVELEENAAVPGDHDVAPISIEAVCATPETRGAPGGVAAIVADGEGYRRELVPVHVDNDDGGGMSDIITRVVSPVDAAHASLAVEGAPLFVWFPPDPALGRPSEVLAVAIVHPYRARTAKPRETAVIGELVGLDDLGRALISPPEPDDSREKAEVAGEIKVDTPLDDKPADPA